MTRCILVPCLLVLVACEDSGRAVDPVWNKQPCAHCHMLLSDPQYAAQLVTKDGERLYFDDVGCLASYLASGARAVANVWVHTANGWRDAYSTRYASGASTPMGYGYMADAHGAFDFAALKAAVAGKQRREAPR
jgi:hypothetical protein